MTTFDYTPFSEPIEAPVITMQSVNNVSYMSTGSTYSSTAYDPGVGIPYSAPRRSKAGFDDITTGEPSDYDPFNPQFASVGDAVLPLTLMAVICAIYIFFRRRKKKAH